MVGTTGGSHRPDMSSLEAQPRLRLAKGDSSYLPVIPSAQLWLLAPPAVPNSALSGVCLFLHRELSNSALETRAPVKGLVRWLSG